MVLSAQLVFGGINLLQSGVRYLAARRNGDRDAAKEIMNSVDLRPFGLDDDELEYVNLAKASLSYMDNRGMTRAKAFEIMEEAEVRGVDVSYDQVVSALDDLDADIDRTQGLIYEFYGIEGE